MEWIRWLLATAGVEFEEEFLETREHEKLLKEGHLLSGHVPLAEIDGVLRTQTEPSSATSLPSTACMEGPEGESQDIHVCGWHWDLMKMIAGAPFKSLRKKSRATL